MQVTCEGSCCLVWLTTLLHEQACISRSARGAVWGVLTCLFGGMLVRASGYGRDTLPSAPPGHFAATAKSWAKFS